jgi:chromosome segregation protein
MLKRLELVGFKSFADKTIFDFDHGITAIVGPNGSGKSNVVDAVRWILGEQSAKSLRGGEMTDVIFNGSASRRSLGLAEVTVTMDNEHGRLATEAREVQITRRVYRSGEGEYLLNQQPCRLKDIKDLFLGSGAGGDAYCIIAQGKVETLLQASTKERRTIFEEAAGISRFKVKKIETLRKLERVDLNVQRLRDILDEVEKQLRSVKLQAAKAQRYQEHTARLRELRVGLGLQEFHQLTEQHQAEWTALESLRTDLEQRGNQVAGWEAEHQRVEETLSRLDEELRGAEAALAGARQQILAQETTLEHEYALTGNLEQELVRLRRQVTELSLHLAALDSGLQTAANGLADAQSQAQTQRQTVGALEEQLQQAQERLHQLQDQVQEDKAEHLEQMRQAARLQNDAVSYKAQIDNLLRELNRLRQKSEQAAETLASLDGELQQLLVAEENLQERLAGVRQELANEQQERDRLRRLRDETAETISELRQQRSGLASRAEVLEGLERSHEGLGAGVAEVLELLERSRSANNEAQPWSECLVGMVADCLTVRREYAPLIDLALGEWSQRFLVRDTDLLAEALAGRKQLFAGRVSFLPLTEPQRNGRPANGDARRAERQFEFSLLGQPRFATAPAGTPLPDGVIARAEQLVTCDNSELQDLPSQLLGRTLVVRDLATARALAAAAPGHRLITLQGELLESDGTLTIGRHHADTGILSRKSELREVRGQIVVLDRRLVGLERDLAELKDLAAMSDSRLEGDQQELQVLTEQAADLRSRVEMHRDRRQGLHEEVTVSRDEISRVEQEVATLKQGFQDAQRQAAVAERQVVALQERVGQAEAAIRQMDNDRHVWHEQWTAGKVALAQMEERVAALQAKYQQVARDLQQRRHEQEQSEQGLAVGRQRLLDSQRSMLAASAALAEGYVAKEQAQRRIADLHGQRERQRQQRNHLTERMQNVRGEWQAHQEQYHAHQLRANDLQHQRDTLADRLREDYQVELGQLHDQASAGGLWSSQAPERESIVQATEVSADEDRSTLMTAPWQIPNDIEVANEEIAELRRKLQRLGSVNLDSLQELQNLELRSATLNAQYEDLTAAKRSLEDIIGKINHDSQRLFQETFETVRGHFQELFRKLFGGGMADVVLEDQNDILECGIEVIARPPGKELRSISLMSGGEKTLTAVALLLAIFRSKPSPFCILDEVDAALDEANIGRFADVLREFLDMSHFIIITHSKRTMAAADVIYGVTMQESGISKRVAVRFEDWPEDGAKPEENAA